MTALGASCLTQTVEYGSFRASVALKKVAVDPEDSELEWRYFDCGPRGGGGPPLVCLPPLSGSADVFYHQCLALSARGQRVVSVEWPAYWSVVAWCRGLARVLDQLPVGRVHLMGAGLGGYLAQKFAESPTTGSRVASLILCNAFTDPVIFQYREPAPMLWLMPAPMLKAMVARGMFESADDADGWISWAREFMLERLDRLDQAALAARLTLNCAGERVDPAALQDLPMTLINVWDNYALAPRVREELGQLYPGAKLAHLKTGGTFPFLSRFDEVNMHIQIHVRNLAVDG